MNMVLLFKSLKFCNIFLNYKGLDSNAKGKLKELLDSQIAKLLHRIDEEEKDSVYSDREF